MMIYSAADVRVTGAFVQFGSAGHLIRSALIESVKRRPYPSEGVVDITLRMVSGKKYRYTVRETALAEILHRLTA